MRSSRASDVWGEGSQLELFASPDAPDFGNYDWVVVNTSGGKDSQATLAHVLSIAGDQQQMDKVIALHVDLGRVEWHGTTELAIEQARQLGRKIYVTRKGGWIAAAGISNGTAEYQTLVADGTSTGTTSNDLLDRVRERAAADPSRPPWPSSNARWCTSDFKRGPAHRFYTWLARQTTTDPARPIRILAALGLRAEESTQRAQRQTLRHGVVDTARQAVDEWLPIHHWSTSQVWDQITSSGLPYHPAYDLGMSRLSCAICVLANDSDLRIGARHNPELAAEILEIEQTTGWTFRPGRSITDYMP